MSLPIKEAASASSGAASPRGLIHIFQGATEIGLPIGAPSLRPRQEAQHTLWTVSPLARGRDFSSWRQDFALQQQVVRKEEEETYRKTLKEKLKASKRTLSH